MEYFATLVVFLTLIGFWGTAFAQYVGNSEESGLIWPPVCIGGSGMCPPYDQWIKEFFSNVISEPFEKSDTVVVGTVIQVEKPNSQSIKYSIDVEFYLKNTQSFDSISATLDNPVEPETFPEVVWYNSPVFKKGDLAFVYLKKMDVAFKVLPQSFAIDKHEVRGPPPSIILQTGPDRRNFEQGQEVVISGMIRKAELYNIAKKGETMDVKITIKQNDKVTSHGLAEMDSAGNYNYKFQTAQMSPGVYDVEINFGPQTTGNRITIEPNLKYWTPLKQFKSGISIDEIQCKENLVLMQNSNGSPACVTFQTGDILVKRGWATCDDGISHGRGHPCGPRSSGIVNFDRDSYKLVNSLDCPISILNQTGNGPIMRPPPMEIQILGKAVRTIEEAKSYSGINDATMPNYIPNCLELRQIFARNAQDGNKEITLLYTLNDTDYSSIKYIDDALQRGLAISFTYEKDSSLGWEGYVDGIVAGNPSKRFDVGDAIFLVTNRNPFQLSATHADTIIDNVRITLTSYIMDADEIKKIAKSMFEN